MKFTFIAVNFNGSFHTKNYLNSLCELNLPAGDSLEAIIVDNSSSEEDKKILEQVLPLFPFARLIGLDKNLGYFKGLNAGIVACRKDDDTHLVIGNNDLIFDKEFLVNLKAIRYPDDVLVIAPNITTFDGRRQNPHVIVRVSRSERIKSRIYFSNYYVGQTVRYISRKIREFRKISTVVSSKPETGQMKIKRGIGACYVLTPHFFRFYQRLDDRVFLWGEEALLSHQVESVNGSTLYDPSIKILHCESASVKVIESRRKYEIVRASYRIYRDYL